LPGFDSYTFPIHLIQSMLMHRGDENGSTNVSEGSFPEGKAAIPSCSFALSCEGQSKGLYFLPHHVQTNSNYKLSILHVKLRGLNTSGSEQVWWVI